MPRMTINIDRGTDAVLAEIGGLIGASDRTEVLRRSIAFLQLAVQRQRPDGTILLSGVDSNGEAVETPVLLR